MDQNTRAVLKNQNLPQFEYFLRDLSCFLLMKKFAVKSLRVTCSEDERNGSIEAAGNVCSTALCSKFVDLL